MTAKIVVTPLMLVLLCPPVVGAQESIEDFVQNIPPGQSVEIGFSPNTPILDLAALVASSDLVVEGEIVSAVSKPTARPFYVSTTYLVRLESVLLDRTPLPKAPTAAMSTVTFSRVGGRLSFQQREIITTDTTLPDFEPGARLVLFLKRNRVGELVLAGGFNGAFRKLGEKITSFLPDGTEARQRYTDLEAGAFRRLIAQATAPNR